MYWNPSRRPVPLLGCIRVMHTYTVCKITVSEATVRPAVDPFVIKHKPTHYRHRQHALETTARKKGRHSLGKRINLKHGKSFLCQLSSSSSSPTSFPIDTMSPQELEDTWHALYSGDQGYITLRSKEGTLFRVTRVELARHR